MSSFESAICFTSGAFQPHPGGTPGHQDCKVSESHRQVLTTRQPVASSRIDRIDHTDAMAEYVDEPVGGGQRHLSDSGRSAARSRSCSQSGMILKVNASDNELSKNTALAESSAEPSYSKTFSDSWSTSSGKSCKTMTLSISKDYSSSSTSSSFPSMESTRKPICCDDSSSVTKNVGNHTNEVYVDTHGNRASDEYYISESDMIDKNCDAYMQEVKNDLKLMSPEQTTKRILRQKSVKDKQASCISACLHEMNVESSKTMDLAGPAKITATNMLAKPSFNIHRGAQLGGAWHARSHFSRVPTAFKQSSSHYTDYMKRRNSSMTQEAGLEDERKED